MEYLIRFIQVHETFRKPEVEALATLANIRLEFKEYSESVRCRSDRDNWSVSIRVYRLFSSASLHGMEF